MKTRKTYFSVAAGRSTDMQYHPAPDFTCGHKHRTIEMAEKCQEKLIGVRRENGHPICSAKWYNSYIVGSSEKTGSGWRGTNDEKLYTD